MQLLLRKVKIQLTYQNFTSVWYFHRIAPKILETRLLSAPSLLFTNVRSTGIISLLTSPLILYTQSARQEVGRDMQ